MDPNGDIQTIVAPITHRGPDDPAASIEISHRNVQELWGWTVAATGFVWMN